jgi:putative acetyltransferase
MISIRSSTPQDGARAIEIWRAAVDATHSFLRLNDRIAIDEEVSSFLPGAPLWLAVDKCDRAIAFMLLKDGHVEALFVDPEHKLRGVGRALIQHALELHRPLTTDVNEQNVAAIEFYEHIGFRRTGRSETDNQGRKYPLIHLCSEA